MKMNENRSREKKRGLKWKMFTFCSIQVNQKSADSVPKRTNCILISYCTTMASMTTTMTPPPPSPPSFHHLKIVCNGNGSFERTIHFSAQIGRAKEISATQRNGKKEQIKKHNERNIQYEQKKKKKNRLLCTIPHVFLLSPAHLLTLPIHWLREIVQRTSNEWKMKCLKSRRAINSTKEWSEKKDRKREYKREMSGANENKHIDREKKMTGKKVERTQYARN